MKVTKTKFDRGGGFFIQFDGKKWVGVEGKNYVLAWGAVFLVPFMSPDFPEWEFQLPAVGPYPSLPVHRGTTDPIILCLARRARTMMNTAEIKMRALDVPDGKEALAELQSGKDIYGGVWPAPSSKLELLDDTIRAVNEGKIFSASKAARH